MEVIATPLVGVYVVQTKAFRDQRGHFYRAFCDQELADILGGQVVRQINVSATAMVGAIRGIHFQYPPFAEKKLVRCLQGKVWDVALDLRKDSPTFLQWYGTELCSNQGQMLVIPEGCAHGFQVLAPQSQLLYCHTMPYHPEAEGGVRYDDPACGITWPLALADLSLRDTSHPLLTSEFQGIIL